MKALIAQREYCQQHVAVFEAAVKNPPGTIFDASGHLAQAKSQLERVERAIAELRLP